jgi:hypothetical protein
VATTRVEAAATGAEVVAAGRRKPEGHWGGGMEGAGRRSDQRGLSAGSAGGNWAQGQRIAVVVASFIRGGIRDLGRMVHGTGEATLTLGGANALTRNLKSFLEQCKTVINSTATVLHCTPIPAL